MSEGISKPERATQRRVIDLLCSGLGWRYIGDWGDRAGNHCIEEPLLTAFLQRSGYSAAHIGAALTRLRDAASTHGRSLYEANRAVYELLRYGVSVKVAAGQNSETVRLLDWREPALNDFAVAEEVTLKGGHERRPDVVLYVNGLAVGVLELKNSRVSIGDGIRQSLSNQRPEFNDWFFSTVQLVMAGNDSEGLRYGTVGTPEKYFLTWKEDEADNAGFKLDKYLAKLCSKERLLELMRDFVLFDGGVKKLPRVHQYFGIKAAQRHVKDKRGGIIWHTQGAGKSILMVLLARWILEHNPHARVAVITDREELDGQIERVLFQKTVFKGRCAIVTSYNPQARDVTLEETGANTESDKQLIFNTYTELLKDVAPLPGKNKTETYEHQAKEKFIKAPAQMKLLIVVDKLLTGFDAPPCTYLYIDKRMQDHGLFQAICRTNRLDGDDKDFGYIVDYKDLFKKVEKAIAVYTSELDHSAGGADPEVMLKDRLEIGRERLDDAIEALALLCEPVQPPKGDLQHIHHFCGNTEIADDLKAREPYRVALYRGVVDLVRAYANVADEMEGAGYSAGDVERIKRLQKHYVDLREVIRKAAGETLDLKPFEADMRHLIDTYIEAQAPRKISPFDGVGLLDLIVKTGIADAIAAQLGEMKGNQESIAETIENNVRSKILREQLTDPAYFAKMSALLDEIIRLRKERAIEYEEYLARIATVVKQVAAGRDDSTPQALKTSAQLALYNNLKGYVAVDRVQEPSATYGSGDDALKLALKLDEAIRARRPDGWRGVVAKEQMVKQLMFEVLKDIDQVHRLFPIVVAQKDY
jgi:type I site-specific restriction-modification system R (restriction) subunit